MGSKKKDSFMWFDLYVCLITKNYILPEREFNEHFNKSNRSKQYIPQVFSLHQSLKWIFSAEAVTFFPLSVDVLFDQS